MLHGLQQREATVVQCNMAKSEFCISKFMSTVSAVQKRLREQAEAAAAANHACAIYHWTG